MAAHWDESTGDLIVRGVVGWGGRGARGDTDRTATRLLGRILGGILESGDSLGLADIERPMTRSVPSVACQHCGFPLVERASGVLPQVRHADARLSQADRARLRLPLLELP